MSNEKTLEDRMKDLEDAKVKTRMKTLEVIAKREARKKQQKISGIIFPFPICGCAVPDSGGIILRTMFPCDGVLVKAVIDIEGIKSLGSPAEIQAELKIEDDVYMREFSISEPLASYSIELPVFDGTKLRVKTTSPEVKGLVWVSLLFIPEVTEATVRRILREDQG